MIATLITSQTRIKLLKKFFLNSSIKAHLRGLEAEFGDSTNAIRIELNRFESAGLLLSSQESNKKLYQANTEHPLFPDIHSIVLKDSGLDRVIENVINDIGNLHCVFLTGDIAHGKASEIIELILIGIDIDLELLSRKIILAEGVTGKGIRFVVLDPSEAKSHLEKYTRGDLLSLWECNEAGL